MALTLYLLDLTFDSASSYHYCQLGQDQVWAGGFIQKVKKLEFFRFEFEVKE
jgi:hypothetical protein